MLISLLIGGIQTAKSEVIVPANTTVNDGEPLETGITQIGDAYSTTYTFTQDFSCSTSDLYYDANNYRTSPLIWGCINAFSSTTDSATTTNTSNISTNTSNISTNTSNIKNLGEGVAASTALTTALTALPQTSKESKLSCGVGTGAYSSKYAIGFGCASKLNERVDVNAGGSYVFGGSKSYGGGTLDSGVLKAGFVFKLGEVNKTTQVSLNESNELKKEVKDLKAKNNQLLARLEKLENIALKFQTNLDEISMSK